MKEHVLAVCAAVASLLCVHTAFGAPRLACANDFPLRELQLARSEVMAQLRARNFAAVEAHLADRLRRYQERQISDEELYRAFTGFESSEPALTPLFMEWQTQSADSQAMAIAYSLHLKSLAYARRGNKFAHETSEQQLDEFVRTMNQAAQLLAADVLQKGMHILALQGLIGISQAIWSWPKTAALLAQANAVAPDNVVARLAAVHALAPRWQGSLDALDRFADEQRAMGLDEQGWRSVRHMVLLVLGRDHMLNKQYDKAVTAFLEAQPLCTRSAAFDLAGQAYYELKQYDRAVEQYSLALAGSANDAEVLRRRAINLEQLGQAEKSLADYRRAAALGDRNAAAHLGRLYRDGKFVDKDLARAAAWFRSAANKGSLDAAKSLRELEQAAPPKAGSTQ